MREGRLDGSEGSVCYRVWAPEGPAERVVLLVHGYAEHGGRYAHVAERLVEEGAAVWAPDHVGHGLSDGERTLIRDFEHVVDDLHALAELARREHGAVPLIVAGHSMGGLLTARFAQRAPDSVAGVAFLGAVLGNWRWAREALAAPELPPADTSFEGMSRDPATVREYREDPLVYHGRYKRPLLEAEVRALDAFNAGIDRLAMPVLFLHGSDDPYVPVRDSLDAAVRMPSRDKWMRVYPGARHELVHETNRAEVLDDLAAFARRAGD